MAMKNVREYLEIFEKLRKSRRWSTDVNVLRFAALILATVDVDEPHRRLEETATALRKQAGAFSPLSSPIRYAVAAMILKRELSPQVVHTRLKEVKTLFRQQHMKRGSTHEFLAALVLVLHAGGRPVPAYSVKRVKDILHRWNQDHPWLTGSDDYPMAALHATRDHSTEQVGRRVEKIYQRLHDLKFQRGNQLQLASHLLAISYDSPTELAGRFTAIRDALRAEGIKTHTSQYDEIALLSLTSGDPVYIAKRVTTIQRELLSVRPRPVKTIAFSLATGLLLAEEAEQEEMLIDGGDLATIRAAQAVLEAQQAAMVAVIASSTAATTAATS